MAKRKTLSDYANLPWFSQYEHNLDAEYEQGQVDLIDEKFRILDDPGELESALQYNDVAYKEIIEYVGQLVSLGLSTTPGKIDKLVNRQIFETVEGLSHCVDNALETWIYSPDRNI